MDAAEVEACILGGEVGAAVISAGEGGGGACAAGGGPVNSQVPLSWKEIGAGKGMRYLVRSSGIH